MLIRLKQKFINGLKDFFPKFSKKIKTTFRTTSPLYVVLFVMLLLYTAFMLYLMFWGIITSLKDIGDFKDNVLGLPTQITPNNFIRIWNNFYVRVNVDGVLEVRYIEDMLLNTLWFSGVGSIIISFVPCIMAYAVTRFNFKFNAVIKGIVIITMVLPIIGSQPAQIKLYRDLGIFDTIIGNFIGKISFLGMNFLIYSAAFEVVPKDFIEAAKMDGASEFKLFTRIMFPMVGTIFTTIYLISFIASWNNYQGPLMMYPTHPTLAVGVYELSRTQINDLNNIPTRMAGCVILLVPVLITFIAFRKKIMGNITLGGVKE